ncbi:unnamed protein product [Camellia sinensis]
MRRRGEYLNEYIHVIHNAAVLQHNRCHCRWCLIAEGVYKVNFDGSVKSKLKAVGIGVIVRDFQGNVVVAMSKAIQFWDDVDCVESMRALQAVKFAKDSSITNIHLGGRFTQCDKGNSRPRDGFVSDWPRSTSCSWFSNCVSVFGG